MKVLTSKIVKTGIKAGYTVSDFCTRYEITGGEEGFVEQLGKAFPNGGSDKVLREIRKNEKNRHRKHHHSAVNPQAANKTAVTKEDNTLKALKLQETTLSDQVMSLEVQHKELAAKRKTCLGELRTIQEEVDKIYQELVKQQAAYETIAERNNAIVRQMNEISETRSDKLATLTIIRAEITKLEAPVFAVYADGNIEPIDGTEPIDNPDEKEVTDAMHQLAEHPLCEDLTVKQIKTLSRVQIISASIPRAEFLFDSPELEKIYLAVTQKAELLF